MVSRNWDEREREIEQEQNRGSRTLRHNQEGLPYAEESDESFATHAVSRFSILKKQRTDKADRGLVIENMQFRSELEDQAKEIRDLREKVSELNEEIRDLREGYKRMQFDDMLEQNEAGRKELESIFGNEPDHADTASLDGLLRNYVDPKQNSQELVRSVRDKH